MVMHKVPFCILIQAWTQNVHGLGLQAFLGASKQRRWSLFWTKGGLAFAEAAGAGAAEPVPVWDCEGGSVSRQPAHWLEVALGWGRSWCNALEATSFLSYIKVFPGVILLTIILHTELKHLNAIWLTLFISEALPSPLLPNLASVFITCSSPLFADFTS